MLGRNRRESILDTRLERRLAPRRNTTIEAEIVFDGGRSRLPCIIRNLSDSGAKLEVAKVASVPQSFDLVVPGHHPHASRVVWRTIREVGIAFV